MSSTVRLVQQRLSLSSRFLVLFPTAASPQARHFGTLPHEKPHIVGTIPQGGKQIDVNQYAEVTRIFTAQEVSAYGKLVGDENPHHGCLTMQEKDAIPGYQALEKAGLLRMENGADTTVPLVHGMLVSSLFSCIFGTLIPGAIYRSQSLTFRAPVFADEAVIGRVDITRIGAGRQEQGGLVILCDTTVTCRGKECLTGEASVWLPGGEKA